MSTLAAKRMPAGGFTRRGACPALSAPMKTGDGLLVRLNLVAGGLTPAALAGLCEAAQLHGNGIIEVSARGGIQIRGLTERSASLFAEAVTGLGIQVHTGVPIQTGVLAGLDPDEITDPTGLVASIRSGIVAAALESRLGPKVSVVVDSGGRTALDEVAADVRLTAVHGGWEVAIAGNAKTARPLGVAVSDDAARDAALSLLSRIADMGREARGRDLSDERSMALASSSGAEGPSLIGVADLRSGRLILGVALPFGQTSAAALKTFADTARALGVEDIRPAPKRTLVAICTTARQAKALREHGQTLDFIVSPDDPRQAISACPGAPECASGHFASRRMAAMIACEHGDLLGGSVHLHVSGCAKGCAHPGVSDLTLVGSPRGIGLVANGTARDEAVAFADRDDAGRAFAILAALVSTQGLPGESPAQTIRRIGPSRLAEAFIRSGT